MEQKKWGCTYEWMTRGHLRVLDEALPPVVVEEGIEIAPALEQENGEGSPPLSMTCYPPSRMGYPESEKRSPCLHSSGSRSCSSGALTSGGIPDSPGESTTTTTTTTTTKKEETLSAGQMTD